MRITSLRIEDFRSLRSLEIELGETTVFIGPNNVGKTIKPLNSRASQTVELCLLPIPRFEIEALIPVVLQKASPGGHCHVVG